MFILLLVFNECYANQLITKSEKPKDIIVDEELALTPPSIEQLKGAIRGVRIAFEINIADNSQQTINLMNPPKGMKILGGICNQGVPPYAIKVQWDIPMDTEEGKVYNIAVKATGITGKEKIITFPIAISKTKPIQTKVKNNELIVIEKKSPLYGMKMKGHNGEDISQIKLRSVKYEDVWKHNGKPLDDTKPLSFTVFVVDNMPEKTDMKFPPYMDTFEKRIAIGAGFDRYTEGIFVGYSYWRWIHSSNGIYLYEDTNGVTVPNTYSRKQKGNRSQMFIFTLNEKL